MILNYLHKSWQTILFEEINTLSFQQLNQFLNQEFADKSIFPPKELIFNCFNLCHFNALKVVIIGQDPYHGAGQANGLSFSVNDGVKFPPSLRNIFKELQTDVNCAIPFSGNLENWAKQGILLLNAILTVENGKPGSHKNKGWETFTNSVIQHISAQKENVVFLLWGNYAIEKAALIDSAKHLILTAAHPSPLARGAFFGSAHFSKTNNYLKAHGLTPIEWDLDKLKQV